MRLRQNLQNRLHQGKDVHGTVTVSLKNVTPQEALQIILEANDYTLVKEGNVLIVVPFPGAEKGAPVETELSEPGSKVQTRAFDIYYIDPLDLKNTLTSLMPQELNIYHTKGSKTLVLEGPPPLVKKAARVIRKLDARPEQVMVEARIIEVNNQGEQKMGVNLTKTNPDNPTEVLTTKGLAAYPTAATATGLYYNITSENVETLIEALSQKSGFNLLSAPKVLATHGQKAEIITGDRLGYKVSTITTTGLVESVEFLDVGTKLVFTPQIKDNGYILMDVHPEVSEGSIVDGLPQKRTTETTTKLMVKDGQTIVIGGLIKDKSQQVNKGDPFISELPILGIPFRRMEITTEKKELIVLLTPHLISTRVIEEMAKPAQKLEEKVKKARPNLLW